MRDRQRGGASRPHARINTARWLGALDALAPYLIAITAVALARHAFASPRPGTVAAVVALVTLAAGTVVMFFRTTTDAHLTWPVTFALCAVLLPLLALHVQFESHALLSPATINLFPLAFTWAGLLIVVALIAGIVCSTATQPSWASVILCPPAVLLGAIPFLSANPSRAAILTAALYVFALVEVVSGVAWLIPERRRWLIVPLVLALGAFTDGRAFFAAPHHLPGRALFLGDVVVAFVAALAALGAPLFCRWLTAPSNRSKPERN